MSLASAFYKVTHGTGCAFRAVTGTRALEKRGLYRSWDGAYKDKDENRKDDATSLAARTMMGAGLVGLPLLATSAVAGMAFPPLILPLGVAFAAVAAGGLVFGLVPTQLHALYLVGKHDHEAKPEKASRAERRKPARS